MKKHKKRIIGILFFMPLCFALLCSDIVAILGNDFLKWRLLLFAKVFSSGEITDWWWAEQDILPKAAANRIAIQYEDGSRIVLDEVRPFDFIRAKQVLVYRVNNTEIDYAVEKYDIVNTHTGIARPYFGSEPFDFGRNGLYRNHVAINGLNEIEKKMDDLNIAVARLPTDRVVFTTGLSRASIIHRISQRPIKGGD